MLGRHYQVRRDYDSVNDERLTAQVAFRHGNHCAKGTLEFGSSSYRLSSSAPFTSTV